MIYDSRYEVLSQVKEVDLCKEGVLVEQVYEEVLVSSKVTSQDYPEVVIGSSMEVTLIMLKEVRVIEIRFTTYEGIEGLLSIAC